MKVLLVIFGILGFEGVGCVIVLGDVIVIKFVKGIGLKIV